MEKGNEIRSQEALLDEMKTLKQILYVNRILSMVSSGLSILLLVVLMIGITRINAFVDEVRIVAEKVSEIDMAQVNDAIEKFNVTMETVDFEHINDSFKEVDMKAIGEIVETIDAAQLEKTLENINYVSEKLKNLSDKLTNLFRFPGSNNERE